MGAVTGNLRPKGPSAKWRKGKILYTTSDEDSWSEIRALEIDSTDSVLSITGSGCRSLNLLLGRPTRLVSIDANPLQNFLLELKVEGMRALTHDEYLGFVGVRDSRLRLKTYSLIRNQLSPEARTFWDLNELVIEAGLLFCGEHETHYRRRVSPLMLGLRRGKVDRLFAFTDIGEQRAFYYREWDNWCWRGALRVLARPSVFRLLLRDPSYYRFIKMSEPVSDYLLRRLEGILTTRLARDNHWLSLLCYGYYVNEEAVPLYLDARYYDDIKANLDILEIKTVFAQQFLAEQRTGTFTKYSLSDISGWVDAHDFERIMLDVARSARPGARFCYRNFLTKRSLPDKLRESVRVRNDIACEIDARDLTFAFTFAVGDIGSCERS